MRSGITKTTFVWGLFAVTTALIAPSTALAANDYIRGIYCGASPELVTASDFEIDGALFDLRAKDDSCRLVAGTGKSMDPLYPSGTRLIVADRTFSSLQRGMTVIYVNSKGRQVAHVLVAKAGDGWRAAGLNNRRADSEPVTQDNLVGVVVAAYQPVINNSITLASNTAGNTSARY